jgi:hypothetical protein
MQSPKGLSKTSHVHIPQLIEHGLILESSRT